MKIKLIVIILILLTQGEIGQLWGQQGKVWSYTYSVPQLQWDESFGNHRAVLEIDKPSEVVSLDFEWRRPDKDVDKNCMLIINACTGDTIPNIQRLEVNNEKCRLLFGPVKQKGIYFSIICLTVSSMEQEGVWEII